MENEAHTRLTCCVKLPAVAQIKRNVVGRICHLDRTVENPAVVNKTTSTKFLNHWYLNVETKNGCGVRGAYCHQSIVSIFLFCLVKSRKYDSYAKARCCLRLPLKAKHLARHAMCAISEAVAREKRVRESAKVFARRFAGSYSGCYGRSVKINSNQ